MVDKPKPKLQKTLTGVVVSDKMVKSVVVKVSRFFAHPLYGKRVRRDNKYIADNTLGAKQGDQVIISQTRPMSKRKRWQVIKIINKVKS